MRATPRVGNDKRAGVLNSERGPDQGRLVPRTLNIQSAREMGTGYFKIDLERGPALEPGYAQHYGMQAQQCYCLL